MPEPPNVKNWYVGLDQYGAGPFEQQQFGTAGVERIKNVKCFWHNLRFGITGSSSIGKCAQ